MTGTADPVDSARPGQPELRVGTGIVCRQTRSSLEREHHHAIRHQVFVQEQGVFRGTDLDVHDRDRSTCHLIGYCDGEAAGSVRLYPVDTNRGVWQGDRLAVLLPYRVRGVGAPLVRCAVATAGEHGGQTMHAHIQLPNVAFFRSLGWIEFGPVEIYAGRPHQPMRIALPEPSVGAAIVRRLAAGISARGR